MDFNQMQSVVRIAVVGNNNMLFFLSDTEECKMTIPHEKYDSDLNGNLDSTVKRLLEEYIGKFDENPDNFYYIGPRIVKSKAELYIVYDIILKLDREIEIKRKHKWVPIGDVRGVELDETSKSFIYLNWDEILCS